VVEFIAWMNRLPDVALYLALAVGAGLENIIPALPADTFVALGGFLAGAGDLKARWVVLGTWLFNVGGALFVFGVSRRHGPGFFEHGVGHHLVRPHQMRRMARFYERWGTPAIFFSRFLPGVRAVVPVFAGATHQPWARVAVPIAVASAIWYGGLVRIGLLAGQNLDTLASMVDGLNATLAIVAGVVGLVIAVWWLRSRREPHE
jgi:membrane protein DedA with SNARE-associated domain